jgi:RHS repeat-associated protein
MTAAVGARNLFRVDAGVVHALLQARYYDGSKGEFLSEDPVFLALGDPSRVKRTTQKDRLLFLSDPQQLNAYSYSGDNPISREDPQGLDGFSNLYQINPYDSAAMVAAKQQLAGQFQSAASGYYAGLMTVTGGLAITGSAAANPWGFASGVGNLLISPQDDSLRQKAGTFAFGYVAGPDVLEERGLVATGVRSGVLSIGEQLFGRASVSTFQTLASVAGGLAGNLARNAVAAASLSPATSAQLGKLAQLVAELGVKLAVFAAAQQAASPAH